MEKRKGGAVDDGPNVWDNVGKGLCDILWRMHYVDPHVGVVVRLGIQRTHTLEDAYVCGARALSMRHIP